MADIDMIPRSWRDGIRLRRTLRRTAAALAIVVLAGAAGSAWLRWQAAAISRQAAQLGAAATQAQSAQARQASILAEHERRAQQEALLRMLRRQGELAAFAHAIDGALPAGAWLTSLEVRRDFQVPASGAIGAGTPAPAAAAADTAPPGTAIALSGQALDYAAMTTFLAQLGRAPGVAGVQLQSSGAAEAGDIAFQATVTLAWKDQP